jgi:hypothetical protein
VELDFDIYVRKLLNAVRVVRGAVDRDAGVTRCRRCERATSDCHATRRGRAAAYGQGPSGYSCGPGVTCQLELPTLNIKSSDGLIEVAGQRLILHGDSLLGRTIAGGAER